MLLTLSLFFLDFILNEIFCRWIVQSLLIHVFIREVQNPYKYLLPRLFAAFLLGLQAFFVYGSFGITFVYLVPILFVARKLRTIIQIKNVLFTTFFVALIIIIENVVLKKMPFSSLLWGIEVLSVVFINFVIVCMYEIYVGIRSSRILPFLGRMRKDRTPNRLDAS